MSLYGNVKKVASSTFQFDKVYPNRVQMEQECRTDGVYAGRYILVEYGIRYQKKEIYQTQYDENNEPHDVIVIGSEQTEEYTNNYNIDVNAFGTPYDSTVWQKIYGGELGEKYVMVAELNALAPKLNLKHINPIVYSYQNGADDDVYIYGENPNNHAPDLVKLQNVTEENAESSFDLVHSNELQYDLNFPDPVKLEVKNDTINYNKEGFDVAYSIPLDENDTNSYIGWVPKNLVKTDVDQTGETKTEDTKQLYMNLPAFGNTVKELYDLIYGKPTSAPYIRPYFKTYWEKWKSTQDITEPFGYTYDEETGKWTSNDDEQWLSEVPDIGEVLANQEEGLAGILSKLFTDRDPLSGTVKFYLQSDWANYNWCDRNSAEMSNSPFIDNKPAVIGYKGKEIVNGVEVEDFTDCDYYIDYNGWSLKYRGATSLT